MWPILVYKVIWSFYVTCLFSTLPPEWPLIAFFNNRGPLAPPAQRSLFPPLQHHCSILQFNLPSGYFSSCRENACWRLWGYHTNRPALVMASRVCDGWGWGSLRQSASLTPGASLPVKSAGKYQTYFCSSWWAGSLGSYGIFQNLILGIVFLEIRLPWRFL